MLPLVRHETNLSERLLTISRFFDRAQHMTHSKIFTWLAGLLMIACGSQPSLRSAPDRILTESESQGRLFDARHAGSLLLGKPLPEAIFKSGEPDYETYWDNGYFSHDLRVLYLSFMDAVVHISPKRRLYRAFLGPSYVNHHGIRIGSTFGELRLASKELVIAKERIKSSLYRPDLIEAKYGEIWETSRCVQNDEKTLNCVVHDKAAPMVRYYFEGCDELEEEKRVEAIEIIASHTDDTKHHDAFVNLKKIMPCPSIDVADPDGLAREGKRLLNLDRRGDYYRSSSVHRAMPVLRRAALAGSIDAAYEYAGIIYLYIHQEVLGDPLNRPQSQGAQEGLLFRLIALLREGEPKSWDRCTARLLDFSRPLESSDFENVDDTDERSGLCSDQDEFRLFSLSDLEGVRRQAEAWSSCWRL